MRTLEQTLGKVERLRRDLSAEIVVQEEEGHQEEQYTERSDWNAYYRETEEVWVVDKPRITGQNREKRQKAREQLQQIYDFSEWYSGRYEAGEALELSQDNLNEKLESWLRELSVQFNAEKEYSSYTADEKIGYYRMQGYEKSESMLEGGWGTQRYYDGNIGAGKVERVPDKATRKKASQDLRYLYKNLPNENQRIGVGKVLGYSKLRIWLHEFFREN